MHASGTVLNVATSSVNNDADPAAGVTAFTAAAGAGTPVFAGMSSLNSSKLQCCDSYDAPETNSTFTLQDSSGGPVNIDADGTNGAANCTATTRTISWDGTGTQAVDSGNGLAHPAPWPQMWRKAQASVFHQIWKPGPQPGRIRRRRHEHRAGLC